MKRENNIFNDFKNKEDSLKKRDYKGEPIGKQEAKMYRENVHATRIGFLNYQNLLCLHLMQRKPIFLTVKTSRNIVEI